MANATITLATLYGGVSRQAPTIRHANQVEEADNVLLSVENGMEKRPGSEMVFAVSDLIASADYKIHVIHRDEVEQYLIIIGQGDVRAFDTAGTEFTVIISDDAAAYLVANSPTVAELRAITIADYTILLNTTVKTGWLDQPKYPILSQHKHWEHLLHHTHPADQYCQTLEQEDPWIQTPGFWRYDPGDGTFATIVFDPVSGDYADYSKYDKDLWNPGGFKANFSRLALAVAASIVWAPAERTLTQADTFANYEWRNGDQIKITAGTDTDAGWYEILSKENDNTIVISSDDVEATGNMSAAAQTDLDATNIGIHSVVTLKFWERSPVDMWEIADSFSDELKKTKGLEDVLVDWEFIDETEGFFTITCPWRGANATMLATESPNAGYDFSLTNRSFSQVGGEYTITAGTGSPETDHLPPADRWIKTPAPGQTKALLDPAKMPMQMVRRFAEDDTYSNIVMADNPFAYWRLGDLTLAGTGDGLSGDYYDNSDYTGFLLTRIDATIDFVWTGTKPTTSHTNNDYYSERWTGFVLPAFTETYTFYANSDDGVRLWVNDVLLIDQWHDQAPTEYSGDIALTAATKYKIRLDHYQGPIAQSVIELSWSAASVVKAIIPQAKLYSSASAGTNCVDEVGNNHGTYVAAPTLGVTGAISDDSDTAVTFDGSSEYVNMGTLDPFGSQLSNGIALEAWIYPTSTSPDAIMGVRDLTGGTNQEILFSIASAGKLSFLITDNNDLTAWFRINTPTIAINTWTHVAVTWHPDTPNECCMYINGIEETASRGSTQHTGDFSFINFDIDFFVGGENYNGGAMGADYAWSGSLDEVVIYTHEVEARVFYEHYLSGIGSTDAYFTVETIEWTGRLSGDHITNPLPSIIEDERTLSDIGFFRNRIALAGDESVVYSQAGDFFNLFIEDASDLSDSDPIDSALTSTQITIVDHIVAFGKRQVIFTKAGRQFETGDIFGFFSPESAGFTQSTAYRSIEGVRPREMENFLFFPAVQQGTTQLLEYHYVDIETSHKAADVSKHCGGYLPSDIQNVQVCLNGNTVLLIEPDGYTIYVYRYYWDGEKKVQSSWARYIFDSTERIADFGVINNDCYALVEDGNNDYYVTSLSVIPDVATSGWEYLVHLDNRVTTTGVYVAAPPAAGTTTWTLEVSDETLDTAVLGPAFGDDSGTEVDITMVSGTSYTAAGDYSAGVSQLGRKFTMNVELTRPYIRDRNGAAILDMSLQLLKIVTNHINTGAYTIRVEQGTRAARNYAFTPRDGSLLDVEGNSQAWLQCNAKDTTISIIDESAKPTIISAAEYAATFTKRSR